jgi:hypothetical protein
MANLYSAIGKQSVGSTDNLFQGYWSHVEFRKGGYNITGNKYVNANKDMYLGAVQEGVLEVSREDNEYLGTLFPRVVELLSPAQVGMTFSGEIGELHKANLHLMVGEDIEETSQFIYPGASCSFGDVFGSLRCMRKKCSSGDPFIMAIMLFKTIGSGAFQIGGAAEVIGSAVEFQALDDTNGDYGGSESAPLGYIYAPDPAAGSTHAGDPAFVVP